MDPLTMSLLAGAGSAAAGGLSSLTQKSGKWKQVPTMSPQQLAQSNWAGQMGQQQIQNPYQGFQPIAQKAQSMFQQQTLPGLAERFTSMGSGGALSSPAYQSQKYGAGQNLSESLAAMMSQYGLQQQGLGQSLLGMGQRPQFENAYQTGGPSFLSGLFGGASQGLSHLSGMGMYQHAQGGQEDALNQILRLLSQRQ